jgi:hypothetical protein
MFLFYSSNQHGEHQHGWPFCISEFSVIKKIEEFEKITFYSIAVKVKKENENEFQSKSNRKKTYVKDFDRRHRQLHLKHLLQHCSHFDCSATPLDYLGNSLKSPI